MAIKSSEEEIIYYNSRLYGWPLERTRKIIDLLKRVPPKITYYGKIDEENLKKILAEGGVSLEEFLRVIRPKEEIIYLKGKAIKVYSMPTFLRDFYR